MVKMLEDQWIIAGDLEGWPLPVAKVNYKIDMDCDGHPAAMNLKTIQ